MSSSNNLNEVEVNSSPVQTPDENTAQGTLGL